MERHRVGKTLRVARESVVSVALAMSVSAQAWADPAFLTIYEFPGGAHGINPEAGVILGPAGSVFGTTDSDGINAGGVVFQLSPPQGTGQAWTQRILKRFRDLAEGGYPLGVTWASTGVLYGVALDGGGSNGFGTVFQLAPTNSAYTNWTFSTLHRFSSGDDGARPSGSLIVDHTGTISGTTILGGAGPGLDGYGIVFSLTASPTLSGHWTETILHRFASSPDGATPGGTLLSHGASIRMGVTTTGGTGICSNVGCGTIFRLVQTSDGWAERLIHQFRGGADGSIPVDRLVAGTDGSLYGATADGGLPGPDGHFVTGTVFRLNPPRGAATHWTNTILYKFRGGEDGYLPEGGVTLDENGTLYGTTEFGGAHSAGTVFKLTPNAPGQPWTKTILHDFGGSRGDGSDPTGHLTLDAGGAIFGTTLWGGAANYGTVYRITQ